MTYSYLIKKLTKNLERNKKDKVVAANVKMRENGKRDDIKRLSNHGFEEDHSYVTMPGVSTSFFFMTFLYFHRLFLVCWSL